MSTPLCPVCGQKLTNTVCPHCGYDESRDYIRYPSLAEPPEKALPWENDEAPLLLLKRRILDAQAALDRAEESVMLQTAEQFRSCLRQTLYEIELALSDITVAQACDFRYFFTFEGVHITGYRGNGTYVVIPQMIEGKIVVGIECNAFTGCGALQSVTIPNGVSSIGSSAFRGCRSLTSINIPFGVTSIERSTFCRCRALSSIAIPNSVRKIKVYAFSGCCSLGSISLPDSVTSIEEYAFEYCHQLSEIYYSGSKEQWEQIAIEPGNEVLRNATVHYNANRVII